MAAGVSDDGALFQAFRELVQVVRAATLESDWRLLQMGDAALEPVRESVHGGAAIGEPLSRFKNLVGNRYWFLPFNEEIAEDVLLQASLHSIRHDGKHVVDSKLLEESFNELKLCSQFEDRDRAWAYLHQFDSTENSIDLGSLFRIRRMNLVERAHFRKARVSVAGRSRAKFLLETKAEARLEEVDRGRSIIKNTEIENSFRDLVTMLRIAKPSSVGLDLVHIDMGIPPGGGGMSFDFNPDPSVFPAVYGRTADLQCVLNQEECKFVKRLWTAFRTVVESQSDTAKRLSRALRRYNNAVCSDAPEDQIVDLVTALEILFKTYGFKMAFYASHLAGRNSKSRGEACKALDRIYDVRSKAVHGGGLDKRNTRSVDELLLLVAQILRSATALASMRRDPLEIAREAAFDPARLDEITAIVSDWQPARSEERRADVQSVNDDNSDDQRP